MTGTRLRREIVRHLRQELDLWFATLARYIGLGLAIYSIAIDRLQNPGILPLATGLIFMKNVVGGRSE